LRLTRGANTCFFQEEDRPLMSLTATLVQVRIARGLSRSGGSIAGIRFVCSVSTAAAMIAVVGCGGSHAASRTHATTTVATTTATSTAAATNPNTQTIPATGALPVNDRVLQPSQFPNYIVTQAPPIVRRTATWATSAEGLTGSQVAAESTRLRRLGFVAGIAEHLHGQFPLMVEALSIVEQYRSSSSARAELAYQYAQARREVAAHGSTFTPFPAAGIPGALGWQASDPNNVGINVLFSDGPFYYGVGAGFPPNAHGAPTHAQLVAEAVALYRLVHGRSAT
jgi:hypothetical protein